jgi:hypothetical protein
MKSSSGLVKLWRLGAFALCLGLTSVMALGQNVGTLHGQVTDPSNASIIKATVTVLDKDNAIERTTETDSGGAYSFAQLPPGNYVVTIKKPGFRTFTEEARVLVATPTRVDAHMQIGATSETVEVRGAAAPAINTEDATVGNTVGEDQVKNLPFLARNVVNLLTIQPGVVFTGRSDTDRLSMGDIGGLDAREGVVDGIRGNQSNITLDGVDVNAWGTQAAFTSAVPLTLDSVQEFRVTTTNANATNGLVGGAQVQLVTKSGTDQYHGNVRWYYRTPATSANEFFDKFAHVPRPQLVRNIAGGSFGGPVKKNRLFFFLDTEARRDVLGVPASQIVASDALRNGVLVYKCASASQCPGGVVQGLTGPQTIAAGTFGISPAQFKTLDPTGLGVNPAMISYMSLFPHGNDPTQGRDTGLSQIGFRFNAGQNTSLNTYIARLDYNLTTDGHHTVSWRGNLEGLNTGNALAQFPGQAPAQTLLNNSRGYGAQYTGQLTPTLINTFHYGYTRQGVAFTGTQGTSFSVRDFATNVNFARASHSIIPVHEFANDVSWIRGKHTIQMGGSLFFVLNNRTSFGSSFPSFVINDGFCLNLCSDIADAIAAGPFPAATNSTAVTRAANMLTGPLTQVSATFLANVSSGTIAPVGSPSIRHFGERYVDGYIQDSWRIRKDLNITAGLRYSYETPVWETGGNQVAPSVDIMQYLQQRITNMNAGIPSDASPLLSWLPAGKANGGSASWYKPDLNNFAPRLSLAYSPEYNNRLGKMLFGGPGKSSLRVGAGLFYDKTGQVIARESDINGSPGTSTSLIDNSQQFSFSSATRFSGTCSLSGCTGLPAAAAPFFNPPTRAQFPFTPDSSQSLISYAVDPNLRTPYSIHLAASFQRELARNLVLDVGYVGTLGRRLLGKVDYSQYENIRDPKSGMDLFTAYQQIARIANIPGPGGKSRAAISPTNIAGLQTIPSIPFFDDMLPGMAAFTQAFFPKTKGYSTLTPTQAFYAFSVRNAAQSWSCALFPLDTPAENGVPSPWNTTVDPQRDGFVLFTPQLADMPGWTNFGNSNYHSLQVSLRKSAGIGIFTANYVWSKSIDNDSSGENGDLINGTNAGLIQNPFSLRLGRAVSDFNLRHNLSGSWVVSLPFGRGQRFGSGVNRAVDALIGGWQVSGVERIHSGFPVSPSNGFNFPTNFFLTSPGTLTGPISTNVVTNGANTGNPPNMFSNPTAALGSFGFTLPGLPGSRNSLTGPAYSETDASIDKAFRMPWSERQLLKLRASAFNVFNQVNFVSGATDLTSPATFGNITSVAGPQGRGARQMEFAARYEF